MNESLIYGFLWNDTTGLDSGVIYDTTLTFDTTQDATIFLADLFTEEGYLGYVLSSTFNIKYCWRSDILANNDLYRIIELFSDKIAGLDIIND